MSSLPSLVLQSMDEYLFAKYVCAPHMHELWKSRHKRENN